MVPNINKKTQYIQLANPPGFTLEIKLVKLSVWK